MVTKLIFVLVGTLLLLVSEAADIIKAYSDVDYQASGAQYLRWSVDVYKKTDEPPSDHICSGSLVSPSVVISAARCFWSKGEQQPASRFLVARSFHSTLDKAWQTLPKSDIQAIHIPLSFRAFKGLYADDIAVVILESPLQDPDLKPICVSFDEELDRKQLSEGNYGRNMGILQLAGFGLPSPLFTALEVPYVSRESCANESEPYFREQITADKICTGFKPGPGNRPESLICRGDHGSGLAFYTGTSPTSIPYLRGVATTPFLEPDGNSIISCSTFPFATFTHVATHREFLKHHIPGIEEICGQYYERVE